MSESANPRALRQAGVVFAWVLAAFLVALVFLAGWVGVRDVPMPTFWYRPLGDSPKWPKSA